ncbi:hypothetical protein Salat_0294000 [Sesamum alatum]|uniref:CCT domain-containing protein n=1 Tax=Sesamum alatum TaxID=300844 RepID=A0AAE1Z1C0_9LAMI|nr:hypothetical protein Salat_0294000 [Sesamum alatum]
MAASLPHHFCSNYAYLPAEFCGGEASNMYNVSNAAGNMVPAPPLMSYDVNSPVSVASFPEQFGVSDSNMAVPQFPEIDAGFCDFAALDYQHQAFEPGEECSRLVPNFWPAYPLPAENWGSIQGRAVTKVEETEVKVGRYSVEERKDRILRYLKKRNQRNFTKTIKYACRKTLADKRVRIRGRFAKNNEPSEDEMTMMNASHDHANYEQNSLVYEDSFQMKYDDDDWLQAAMANLVHLPYFTS